MPGTRLVDLVTHYSHIWPKMVHDHIVDLFPSVFNHLKVNGLLMT